MSVKNVAIDDVREWNKLIKKHCEERLVCDVMEASILNDVVDVKDKKVVLKTAEADYYFWLDGDTDYSVENLRQYLGSFTRALKKDGVRKLESKRDMAFIKGTANYVWYNEEFDGERHKAWEYDMNSAYVWSAVQDWPDVNQACDVLRVVGKGEIGLAGIDDTELAVEGEFANIVWKKMECPKSCKEWFERLWEKKKNAKDKREKQQTKMAMVAAIGNLANYNPYIRNVIVSRVNRFMKELVDTETTLKISTDAIVSTVERKDLKIGKGLGEFKVEHSGEEFAYVGRAFQWGYERPHLEGVIRMTMREGYDLLKDGIIKEDVLPYRFNWADGTIEEVWKIDI